MTHIFASLNQNLSNRYLYQFNVKIDPAGTTAHRFGFHFFSDSGSLSNRGNSYFIFFRQETSKLEFYRVVGDVYSQTKVVNNVTTAFGQWYDIKVIFDRTTGKIDVYRDDVFLASWTDPAPLATSGKYISFRTGNSKLSINELKVFRSRASSVNVAVGAAATNDIRYQNPDPAAFSAKIKSIVNDAADNLSAIDCKNLNIDWTQPVCNTVNDGTGSDTETTTSTTSLSANWTASSDSNSGIAKYYYAIGTTPGDTNITGWTDNALNTSVTKNGLALTDDPTYYFSVKTENGAGLTSICHSNGVMVFSATNISENEGMPAFSVFPNPFGESATIDFQLSSVQHLKISLTDIFGRQIIISDKLYKAGKHSINIHSGLLHLSKGMYFLEVRNEKLMKVEKIVHF